MRRNIYIDGENFVHIVLGVLAEKKLIKNRSELNNLDFAYIIEFVTRSRPSPVGHTRYYGAQLRVANHSKQLQKQSQAMVAWNAGWVTNLNKQGIEYIKSGRLKVRDSHVCSHCGKQELIFQEKGVDVGLAVDLVSDALKGHINEAVIFSADSDMLPAIKRVHGAKVKVIYAAYSGGVNRALTTMVDEVWTYSSDQIVEAFLRTREK